MIRLLARSRHSLVCQQAVELVTDYLEGALPRAQRRRLEAHLTKCHGCTEYLAQMRATIALSRSITTDDLTPEMQAEFIALYQRWQADRADGPAAESGPGATAG